MKYCKSEFDIMEIVSTALSTSIYNLYKRGKGFGIGYNVVIEVETDSLRVDLLSENIFQKDVIKSVSSSLTGRRLNEVISDLERQIVSLF